MHAYTHTHTPQTHTHTHHTHIHTYTHTGHKEKHTQIHTHIPKGEEEKGREGGKERGVNDWDSPLPSSGCCKEPIPHTQPHIHFSLLCRPVSTFTTAFVFSGGRVD